MGVFREMLAFRTSVYAARLGVILPVEAGVMLTLAVSWNGVCVMLAFRNSVYAVTLGGNTACGSWCYANPGSSAGVVVVGEVCVRG